MHTHVYMSFLVLIGSLSCQAGFGPSSCFLLSVTQLSAGAVTTCQSMPPPFQDTVN